MTVGNKKLGSSQHKALGELLACDVWQVPPSTLCIRLFA